MSARPAEPRPWPADDPAAYDVLDASWPHESPTCEACRDLEMWVWLAQIGRPRGGVPSRRRDLRAAADAAFAAAYPLRFRAAADHRRAVAASRRRVPPEVATMRSEASRFLVPALAEARRKGIIPRIPRDRSAPFWGPWPSEWECAQIAESDLGAPLVVALRAAYPARFGIPTKHRYRDPARYAASLLRAVIAGGRAGQAPLRARSPTADLLVGQLHRLASADGQMFCCIWHVDHADFSRVDEATVGAVVLRSDRPGSDGILPTLLPEGTWALGPDHTWRGAQDAGYLVAQERTPEDHWGVWAALNRRISAVVAAIRLATATTGAVRTVWIGEPSMVHIEAPEAHPQREREIFEPALRRAATLTAPDLPGLELLAAMVERAERPRPVKGAGQGAPSSISIALGRYARSHTGMAWQDVVLDLATGLEACLGPQTSREEIGLTLRTRAAHLLASEDPAEAAAVYNDVRDLYDLRSDLVHGSPKYRRTPDKLFRDRGIEHALVEYRMHILLDRWRDVLRRAIAARLLLADDAYVDPLWPAFGDDSAVDLALVRADTRAVWSRRIADTAARLGLPALATRSQPLVE